MTFINKENVPNGEMANRKEALNSAEPAQAHRCRWPRF